MGSLPSPRQGSLPVPQFPSAMPRPPVNSAVMSLQVQGSTATCGYSSGQVGGTLPLVAASVSVAASGSVGGSSGPEPLPELSAQQRRVVRLVLEDRKSIFFTGSAGTGKSRTLREIVSLADPQTTRVTALTGIAASILPGGTTLHSCMGIGLGKEPREKILKTIQDKPQKCWMWQQLELLVVDEASMMSRHLFELLEYLARAIRGNDQPFGGLRLCLCGDFFQLPPVSRGGSALEGQFCFESPLWAACIPLSVELTTVYRQRDASLIRLLAEVRYNRASEDTVRLLQSLARPLHMKGGVLPTRLFPANSSADRVNANCLAELPGEAFTYRASDKPAHMAQHLSGLTLYPEVLQLKLDAQVMLLKNQGQLVNGSRGVVVDFVEGAGQSKLPVVRWLEGPTLVVLPDKVEKSTPSGLTWREQLPLKLAWAITIHKAQGMSIDLLEVDLAHVFEKGQAYVALSRARTLEGLRVNSFDARRFWTEQRVVNYYAEHVKAVDALEGVDEKRPAVEVVEVIDDD